MRFVLILCSVRRAGPPCCTSACSLHVSGYCAPTQTSWVSSCRRRQSPTFRPLIRGIRSPSDLGPTNPPPKAPFQKTIVKLWGIHMILHHRLSLAAQSASQTVNDESGISRIRINCSLSDSCDNTCSDVYTVITVFTRCPQLLSSSMLVFGIFLLTFYLCLYLYSLAHVYVCILCYSTQQFVLW